MREWDLFIRHVVSDFAILVAIGVFPSVVIGSSSKRDKGIIAAFIASLGLALLVVVSAHAKLFETLVLLPRYDWVHKLTLGVVFAVLSLPVSWLASRRKIPAGWFLVIGLVSLAVPATQAAILKIYRPPIGEEVSLRRCLNDMENYKNHEDHGGLARTIENISIPGGDKSRFDLVFAPILRESLFYDHPSVARAAAAKLGERGDPSALPSLLDAVTDAPPVPRREMESTIEKLAAHPDAGPILVKILLNYDGQIRKSAFEYLVENHPSEIETAIPRLLVSGDEEVRGMVTEIVKAGAEGVNVAGILDGLAVSLRSGDIAVSGSAAVSLAAMSDLPEVRARLDAKSLIRILKDGGPAYRPAAAKLLKVVPAANAIPALLESARSNDPQTAREALSTLVAMRAGEATEIFGESIGKGDPATRALGFEGLRYVLPRNMPTTDPLVKKITMAASIEKNTAARRSAAGLLAWLDLPGAYEYADGLQASSADSADKLAAIIAFDLMGEYRAIRSLLVLAQDKDPLVRGAAIKVIGHVGDSSILPELRRIADDPDPVVRAALEEAIREVSKRDPGANAPGPPLPGPFTPGSPPVPRQPEPPPW